MAVKDAGGAARKAASEAGKHVGKKLRDPDFWKLVWKGTKIVVDTIIDGKPGARAGI